MFVGVGLGRFAYTPIVPFLAQAGIDPVQAGYAGAANLAGYFLGAAMAHRLGVALGAGRAIRGALVLTILSFLGSAAPLGFLWLAIWRLLAGITGGVLMVVGASTALGRVAIEARGRAAGVIMTGVGLGVILGSAAVGPLAGQDVRLVWLALAGLSLVASAVTWPAWRDGRVPGPKPGVDSTTATRFGPAVLLLVVAYGFDGAGFVPHTIFWVDYVARALGLGPWGGLTWLGFGAGALAGPVAVGVLADRLGFGRSLIVALLVKTLAIVLAIVAPAPAPLMLSAFLVGALSPGMSALVSARLLELLDHRRHGRAWGLATLGFSAAQAAGGLALSSAFAALGTYPPIYGAGALLEAAGLALAAWGWAVGGSAAARGR